MTLQVKPSTSVETIRGHTIRKSSLGTWPDFARLVALYAEDAGGLRGGTGHIKVVPDLYALGEWL